MRTQAQLFSNGEFATRWIENDRFEGPVLSVGSRIVLTDDPTKIWIIAHLFLSLEREESLPVKAVKSTILLSLGEDGASELASVYPIIYMV